MEKGSVGHVKPVFESKGMQWVALKKCSTSMKLRATIIYYETVYQNNHKTNQSVVRKLQ
jgi:nucleoside diphosphate kinase